MGLLGWLGGSGYLAVSGRLAESNQPGGSVQMEGSIWKKGSSQWNSSRMRGLGQGGGSSPPGDLFREEAGDCTPVEGRPLQTPTLKGCNPQVQTPSLVRPPSNQTYR